MYPTATSWATSGCLSARPARTRWWPRARRGTGKGGSWASTARGQAPRAGGAGAMRAMRAATQEAPPAGAGPSPAIVGTGQRPPSRGRPLGPISRRMIIQGSSSPRQEAAAPPPLTAHCGAPAQRVPSMSSGRRVISVSTPVRPWSTGKPPRSRYGSRRAMCAVRLHHQWCPGLPLAPRRRLEGGL